MRLVPIFPFLLLVAACRGTPASPAFAPAPLPSSPGVTGLLLEEHFADPSLPGWRIEEGASTGTDGPPSTVRVDDGALLLSADAHTEHFLAALRDLPVSGVRQLLVSARMRTEDVTPAGAQFVNCDVFVRFGTGRIVAASPNLSGSRPWTNVSRVVRVPEGTTAMTVGIFLSMPGRAWFDDLRIEAAPDFIDEPSGHFLYKHLPSDEIPAAAAAANDAAWERAAQFFGWSPSAPVVYWKYRDRKTLAAYTGETVNGMVEHDEIHTVWSTEPHELAHIFAAPWGNPPPLLGEGLAVYFSGAWHGRPIGDAAKSVLADGKWVPLAELLDARAFRARPDLVTYPIAGSLAQWIDTTEGHAALRMLYGRLRADATAEDNAKAFLEVVRLSVADADEKLRGSL